MAFILQAVESHVNDLLWQISEDYGLDHGELCERYLGVTATPKAPRAEKAKAGGRKKAAGSSDKKKCAGKTVKGQACRKNAMEGCDYCSTHMPKEDSDETDGEADEGPKKCAGKTVKGKACTRNAASDSDYCKLHEPKMEELDEETEGDDEKCKAVTGKKKPCRNKAVCEGFCKTHSKGPFKLKEPVHNHEPGEEDEDCDSCAQYGDPVNGSKKWIDIVEAEEAEEESVASTVPKRRSERIKLKKLLEVAQEKMDGDDEDEAEEDGEGVEDLLSFAQELEKQMLEEEF